MANLAEFAATKRQENITEFHPVTDAEGSSNAPLGDTEISEFCSLNYGVTFPMFSKIEVNGDGTHPLFKYLKSEAKGMMGSEAIKWNFTKFLVDQNGNVLKRFAPKTEPKELIKDIETRWKEERK